MAEEPLLPEHITPGAQIDGKSMYSTICKSCADELVIARLQGIGRVWRAFDRQPIDRNGLRFYRKHHCGQRKLLHATQS